MTSYLMRVCHFHCLYKAEILITQNLYKQRKFFLGLKNPTGAAQLI